MPESSPSPAALAEALLQQVEHTRSSAAASEILVDDLLCALRSEFEPEAPRSADRWGLLKGAIMADAEHEAAESFPPARFDLLAAAGLTAASGATMATALALGLGVGTFWPVIPAGAVLAVFGWAICAAGADR